ncbi:MAG: SxtJ family membrane protein [Planctomycetota bacterium]
MALHEINWRPSARQLRQFSALLLVFCQLAAMFLYWRTGVPRVALGVSLAGALCGAGGLAWPRAARPVYLALVILGFPVGWAVSHAVLAVFYFGVLTPLGLCLRLSGRDPLARKFDKEAQSYWRPHEPAPENARYFRQF